MKNILSKLTEIAKASTADKATDNKAKTLTEAAQPVTELSKNTLGNYVKKANDVRAHEPDDRKADNRGTGVMKALDKIAGGVNKGNKMKGNAVQARFSNAKGLPTAAKDRETFNRSVDRRVASESEENNKPALGKRDWNAEAAQPVTELSKNTLGRYVKRAAFDAATLGQAAGASITPDSKPGDGYKAAAKAVDCVKGIRHAVDRLTKEPKVVEGEYDESELYSGCYVVDEQDPSREVFVMIGDPEDRRVRIEDKDGRGWYITPSRLRAVPETDRRVRRYFPDSNNGDDDFDDEFDESMNVTEAPSAASMGRAAEREWYNTAMGIEQPSQRPGQAPKNLDMRKIYLLHKPSGNKVGGAFTNFGAAQTARSKMKDPQNYSLIKEDGTVVTKKEILEYFARNKKKVKVVAEGVELSVTDSGLAKVLRRFPHEVANFKNSGELADHLYDALYDHYAQEGEMPYGVMKARDGDPYEWIANRLESDLGLSSAMQPASAPVVPEGMGGDIMEVTDEEGDDWYDATGKVDPNGAYDAGGHYDLERDTPVDEEMLMEKTPQDITVALSEVGLDEGLDFFFDNSELVVIGRSTATVVINTLKRIGCTASVTSSDGEEIRLDVSCGSNDAPVEEADDMSEGFVDDIMASARKVGLNPVARDRAEVKPVTPPAPAPALTPEQRASSEARLAELEKQFDQYYDYSDDHSYWSKQNSIAKEINTLKRMLGDSKVNDNAAISEDATLSLNVDGTDDVLNVLKKLSGVESQGSDLPVDDIDGVEEPVDDMSYAEPSMRDMISTIDSNPDAEVDDAMAGDTSDDMSDDMSDDAVSEPESDITVVDAEPEVEVEEEYANEPDEKILPGYGTAKGDKDGQGRRYPMTNPGNNPMAAESKMSQLMRSYEEMLNGIKAK